MDCLVGWCSPQMRIPLETNESTTRRLKWSGQDEERHARRIGSSFDGMITEVIMPRRRK